MIRLHVNGRLHEVEAPPLARLLDVLRVSMRLTGTKEGCGEGECGACTVLLDGVPVNACLVAAGQCVGREIQTIEGLTAGAKGERLTTLQQCFVETGGAQCGICTPGMLLSAEALLRDNPRPTDSEVRDAIAGNLCRCTGYQKIVDAIAEASLRRSQSDPPPSGPAGPASGGRRCEHDSADGGDPDVPPLRPREDGDDLPSHGRRSVLDLLAKGAVSGLRTALLAGGTDWIVDRHMLPVEKATPLDQVIDLTGVEALSRISFLTQIRVGSGGCRWAGA